MGLGGPGNREALAIHDAGNAVFNRGGHIFVSCAQRYVAPQGALNPIVLPLDTISAGCELGVERWGLLQRSRFVGMRGRAAAEASTRPGLEGVR